MSEEVSEGFEENSPGEFDESVFSIEEFVETKLCAAHQQSAKEAEWQAKRQAREAERQAKRQPILARGQPLFDAGFAKVDTAETGSLSKAQVKAVVEKILTFQDTPDDEIEQQVKEDLDWVMGSHPWVLRT